MNRAGGVSEEPVHLVVREAASQLPHLLQARDLGPGSHVEAEGAGEPQYRQADHTPTRYTPSRPLPEAMVERLSDLLAHAIVRDVREQMKTEKLAHTHRCPFCLQEHECSLMWCRGLSVNDCWPCRRGGLGG